MNTNIVIQSKKEQSIHWQSAQAMSSKFSNLVVVTYFLLTESVFLARMKTIASEHRT